MRKNFLELNNKIFLPTFLSFKKSLSGILILSFIQTFLLSSSVFANSTLSALQENAADLIPEASQNSAEMHVEHQNELQRLMQQPVPLSLQAEDQAVFLQGIQQFKRLGLSPEDVLAALKMGSSETADGIRYMYFEFNGDKWRIYKKKNVVRLTKCLSDEIRQQRNELRNLLGEEFEVYVAPTFDLNHTFELTISYRGSEVYRNKFQKKLNVNFQGPNRVIDIHNGYVTYRSGRTIYELPPNLANGGVDVNILDWKLESQDGVLYRIYRKSFGETAWSLLQDNVSGSRYLDANLDKSQSYLYEIRLVSNGQETVVEHSRSMNYDLPVMGPQNVLVLINTRDPGFVQTTETSLMDFLSLQDSDFEETASGERYNAKWHVFKNWDTGFSVPLGIYYAWQRNIPLKNIVFIDVPLEERADMTDAEFQSKVVDPIRHHMEERGLTQTIESIVSCWRFPIKAYHGGNGTEEPSWEEKLNYELTRSFMNGESFSLADRFDSGRRFSRAMGDLGFLTTRIDAPELADAKRMIDDAIWAEENYHFNDEAFRNSMDLMAYVDWEGPYEDINDCFLDAAGWIQNSNLFGEQGDHWDMAPNVNVSRFITPHDANQNGLLDNTFLFMGWYSYFQYQDVFEWARGSIGWSLDSASGRSFRNMEYDIKIGTPQQRTVRPWGANVIGHGAAASLGAVDEPFAGGHTSPDLFAYYLLRGYSFAEAGYFSSVEYSREGWQYAFNGDPLYTPFYSHGTLTRFEPILEGSEIVGRRHILKESMNGNSVYRDYNLQGRLIGERLGNGDTITHTPGGQTIVAQSPHDQMNIEIKVYSSDGQLIASYQIPGAGGDFDKDEISWNERDGLTVRRHYKDSSRLDIFNTDGLLINYDSEGQITGLSLVRVVDPHRETTSYEMRGQTQMESYTRVDGSAGERIHCIQMITGQTLAYEYEAGSDKITRILYTYNTRSIFTVEWQASQNLYEARSSIDSRVHFTFYTAPPCPSKLIELLNSSANIQGDFNQDGLIGVADYALWAARYSLDYVGPDDPADGNGDGYVNYFDYLIWVEQMGRSPNSPNS